MYINKKFDYYIFRSFKKLYDNLIVLRLNIKWQNMDDIMKSRFLFKKFDIK